MAILEKVKEAVKDVGKPLDKRVHEKLHRGRERMLQGSSKRNEYLEFWRGNHYAYVDEKNLLQFQATQTSVRGTGKAPWRQRRSVNLIFDAVEHEVSRCTQRVPSYQVVPSTQDISDASAADLAEKILLYGHDKWKVHKAMVGAVRAAVVAEEAFIWPHWDSSVGPYIEGEGVGLGEIRLRLFTGNQVYWEPGVPFDESRWLCVEYALPIEDIVEMDGYLGGKPIPDADALSSARKGQDSAKSTKMALVKEYLERPCPKYPDGRWLTVCNDRQIIEERPYPNEDTNGVVDEPVLHRLVYCDDPDNDRGVGLVRHLVDAQRMYNWARSKLMEYAQLGLVPQAFGPPGFFRKQRISDEPGRFYEVNGNPNELLRWRENIDTPPELFQMLQLAEQEIGKLAAQNAIPSQVEAGKAIQALIERDDNRGQQFLANVANVYASVGSHCLRLVQRHYTEGRVASLKGSFGWETQADFMGAKLNGQADVRVFPASIEPRTKESIEQRIYLAMSSGWIPPERGLHALQTGTVDDLVKDIDLAVGRIHRIIQRIKQGPLVLHSMQPRLTTEIEPQFIPGSEDPVTGIGIPNPYAGMPMRDPQNPQMPRMDPGWMPQMYDNVDIWKAELEAWFQTEEAEHLEPPVQEAASQVYETILKVQAQKQMLEAQAVNAMAEAQGMQNAGAPQGPKPLPDQLAPPGGNPAPTRNQPADQSAPR